jgi:flagellar basal-body rod protein FlgC
MGLFGAIDISTSGLKVFRTWMDSVAENLSNVRSTAPPGEQVFQSKVVVAQAAEDGRQGVFVREIQARDELPNFEFDPTHPYADPDTGLVRYAGVDMGREMTNLIAAQRGYQANLTTIQTAREAYQAALRLGRG